MTTGRVFRPLTPNAPRWSAMLEALPLTRRPRPFGRQVLDVDPAQGVDVEECGLV